MFLVAPSEKKEGKEGKEKNQCQKGRNAEEEAGEVADLNQGKDSSDQGGYG